MESFRVLVVPGLRTVPKTGLWARLATAFAVVVDEPRTWLLGAAGFLLRGGIVVLVAPILVVPTQVEIRLLLGDYLGTSGFTPSFSGLLIGLALLTAAGLVGLVLLLARLEMALFCSISAHRRLIERTGEWPRSPAAHATRRPLFAGLVTVQVWAVVAMLIAGLPLASGIGEAAYAEVVRPSSSAPIYERVLAAVTVPLVLFIGALVAIEALSAVISRRVLVSRGTPTGLIRTARLGLGRALRSPARTLATALAGWAVALAAFAPVLAILLVTWHSARRAFLSSVSFADIADPRTLMSAVVLAGAFLIGVVVVGFVAALRSAIWTVDSLS